MLTLFGRITSINVRKVSWTAAELGLAMAHEGLGGDDLREPGFVAMNPNALVPVLQDGALVLWESNAICRYLARRERHVGLLPDAPRDAAVVEQWMDWQATELNNAWRPAFLGLVRRSPAHADPAAIAASVAAWNSHMRILDDRLAATGAYVAGPGFTLADIVLGLAAHRWSMAPIERPALAAVAAWQHRLSGRAAYRDVAHAGLP